MPNYNVNTTGKTAESEARETARIDQIMKAEASKMRRIYYEAPTMDIKLPLDKDSKDRVLEGGINGVPFALPRGVRLVDIPLPIIDVLEESQVEFSKLTGLKPSLAQRQAPAASAATTQQKPNAAPGGGGRGGRKAPKTVVADDVDRDDEDEGGNENDE